MLFKSLAANALLACAALLPSAMADAEEVSNAAPLDITVKFNNNERCTAPGPARDYSNGACIPLGATAKAVDIIDRRGSCKLVSYTGGACSGNARNLDNNGCWTLRGRKSIKVRC
ncbi:unnamed protein product [Clonostachys rosea f. rosea IK726]|uniref:Uncharacterized protein n=1 Tax=Clonostachys rosea f. rosea IK726 TaxID=1349383 RepID=A0ACA9ULQ7_BIOOC|nr:unnamed protein product [Clonostachys rosea f. rosea IK726]